MKYQLLPITPKCNKIILICSVMISSGRNRLIIARRVGKVFFIFMQMHICGIVPLHRYLQQEAQSLSSADAKNLKGYSENTNKMESITVPLTSCLFCVDSVALLMLNEQQFSQFGQIQTSQTGGPPYNVTLPMVSAQAFPIYSLIDLSLLHWKKYESKQKWFVVH